MKKIDRTPLGSITKIRYYVADCKMTMAEVKRATGCDKIINGGMWTGATGKPCPILKVDGKLLSSAPWHTSGYGFEDGPDIRMTVYYEDVPNFLAVTALIVPQVGAVAEPSYDAAQGGKRGRSALGITKDRKLLLYCSTDGSDAKTPEALRDELVSLGCDTAIMLDGGGSCCCDFGDGAPITTSRKCHNYICVWVNDDKPTPPDPTPPKPEDDEPRPEHPATPVDQIRADICAHGGCMIGDARTITPEGIMVHSTAMPGVMAQDLRDRWDRPEATATAHACLDDVETIQCLPWTHRGWHCGDKANATHISFEICEPSNCRLIPIEWVPLYRGAPGMPKWSIRRWQSELTRMGLYTGDVDGSFGPSTEEATKAAQRVLGLTPDGSCGKDTLRAAAAQPDSLMRYDPEANQPYFDVVWARAVALCAYLCRTYHLTPDSIICHSEGHRLGIASNHADIMHWAPEHGKDMDDLRNDVAAVLDGPDPWAADAWSRATARGLVDGTRPRDTLTRQEAVTMLDKLGVL